jgi:peptidyl-prolyl cis-trans isomerase D
VPLRPDAIRSIAQLWVNYQLVALAGARGDTLGTIADADAGMWAALAQLKFREVQEVIGKDWGTVDSMTFEQKYNDGVLLGAQHILLAKQPEGVSPEQNAVVRAEAERLLASLKGASAEVFGAAAKRRTDDPGSKDRGGSYGVFPSGQMVPEFDAGIRSVQPGQISGVVETQFGYHIIRRHTFAEIRDQFGAAYASIAAQEAESTYFAKMDSTAQVKIKPSAAKLVKAIAEDPDGFRGDKTVIATSKPVTLTASRVAQWMAAFPPQSRVRAQVAQAADSVIPTFVENLMRNELVLRVADSLQITLDTAEVTQVRQAFFSGVKGIMEALGVTPTQLADSASDEGARVTLAANRANTFLGQVIRNEVQYIEVPEQLASVLRERFDHRVTPAGLDRVLAEATKRRAVADSARAASMPPSAVPMGPPTAAPAPAAPVQQP